MTEPGANLDPLTRRFCELHAAEPDACKCVCMARAELGLRPPKNNRVAQRLAGYLKLKPGGKEYWEHCQGQLAKLYPGGKIPPHLVQHAHGPWPRYTPEQLAEKAHEYFKTHKDGNLAVGPADFCAFAGITLSTLKIYRKKEAYQEVAEWIFTECVAWLERQMAGKPKEWAQAMNYQMNRMGFPEKDWERERALAQPGAGQAGAVAILVTVEAGGTIKKIENVTVPPPGLPPGPTPPALPEDIDGNRRPEQPA